MAREVLDHGVVLPAEYSDNWYEDMTSNLQKLDEVIGSDGDKLSAADVATVAISGDYDDLTNKPSCGILRMTSETLTDSGSGAISNLNSDSKLSAGDYVLDAALKVFPITAVSAPSYTVGTSLFQITNASSLAAVATSGSYDDLNNLPTYGITRFVNAAISDNSNVAFANISSVDKIKAGDFLLDNAGKMYLIASIDSVNETAAVTTPLTQLAVDSGVVHNYGDESIAGIKTFLNIPIYTTFDGIRFRCAHNSNAYITFRNVNQANPGSIIFSANDGSVGTSIHLVDKALKPYTTNDVNLGTTSQKWKSLNGINPGSLSLPDLSNGIDISGYFDATQISTNTYTALVDGYISLAVSSPNRGSINAVIGSDFWGTTAYGAVNPNDSNSFLQCMFVPILKNQTITVYLRTTGGTLESAKFYPCLGNV